MKLCNQRKCTNRLKTSLALDLVTYSTHNHRKNPLKITKIIMEINLKVSTLKTLESRRKRLYQFILNTIQQYPTLRIYWICNITRKSKN